VRTRLPRPQFCKNGPGYLVGPDYLVLHKSGPDYLVAAKSGPEYLVAAKSGPEVTWSPSQRQCTVASGYHSSEQQVKKEKKKIFCGRCAFSDKLMVY
jgi:hypothetical protein